MIRAALALAPALALALSAPAPAQEEELRTDEPLLDVSFKEMVEVSEVLLDVLVTDGEGNAVEGLGKDDFIVEEDGEPVKLTGVSYYTTRYSDDSLDSEAEEPPASRFFILFFHSQWQSSSGTNLIRRQLRAAIQSRQWIREEMLPSDWIAVVSYGSKFQVYQDFTQDRDALERAVKGAASGKKPSNDVALRRRTGGFELSILQRLPRGRELRQRSKNIYEAISLVAEATGYAVGRKNLLLFTTGFGKFDHYGRQAEPDPKYYPQLETLLNDHNVAVYPINLSAGGRGYWQTDFLTKLAEDTGGFYDDEFVRFIQPLRDIGHDNYAYYVLSYQSEHPAGEIGYQEIEVRTKDESMELRSRQGYRYGL